MCKAISGDDEEDARRAVVGYFAEFSPPGSYTLDTWFDQPAGPLSTDDLEVRSRLQAAERAINDWRLVMSADRSSDALQGISKPARSPLMPWSNVIAGRRFAGSTRSIAPL